MIIAEVVETKKSFKPDQVDDDGNYLALGSIEVRIGSHQSNLGQVRNIFVRPAIFNRRIPLIGEQVILIPAPVNDWSTSGLKNIGYSYLAVINATDDLVLHAFPRLWRRKGLAPAGSSAERKSDKREWGYTFEQKPKRTPNIQPFEGDDIYEGRFGTSIRFGSTIKGGDMSVYAEKPTWDGSGNGDPIMILRVKKPTAGSTQSAQTTEINNNKYEIEDIEKDESTIVLTSNQKLKKFKAGFDKNQDAKKLGQYDGKSQIAINSNRVVINANKDMALILGKEKVVISGKKVLFQTEKHKVDLDELMDFLKKWMDEFSKLCQGTAFFSSPSGPTGPSNNVSQVMQLQTSDFTKFKQP
jgi:hypothetical protein